MWNVYSPSPSPRSRRWLDRRIAILGGTIAVFLVTFGVGIVALADHLRSQDGSPLRAPAGLALLSLALTQARILFPLAPIRELFSVRHRVFWRGLIVGAIASYLVAAIAFPYPGVEYVFAALAAAWYTLGLVWVRWPNRMPALRNWGARRSAATFGWCLFLGVLALAIGEAGLRIYGHLVDDHLPITVAARARQLAPGSKLRGRSVNSLGYWGSDFRREPRPGMLRVAVLGDEVALSGTAATNCFMQLEKSLPGVEVYNFAIPEAGIREYAAQLRHQVLDYRPDLVLVLVSVGDDITERLPTPGHFDVRSLRLYQLAALGLVSPGQGTAACADADVRRSFACRAQRQMIVCETPLDDTARAHWDHAESHIDDLIDRSQQRGAKVALVGVPTVFQICAPLSAQLQKRAGYQA